MIKILQIMSSVNVNSGIANVIMNYFRSIDRTKYHFDFLVFGKASTSFCDEINSLGGEVYYFTKPGLKTYFQSKKEIEEFFKKNKYDIIHCNEILIAKMVFKIVKKYNSSICVSHAHNSKLSDYGGIKELRNKILVSGLAKKSYACIACSEQAAICAFGKKILNDKKLYVMMNAIDVAKYRYSESGRKKIREEFGIKGEYVLCNVGRLSGQKNQLFLIDVVKRLKEEGVQVKLILAGDGELKEVIKSKIIEENLSNEIILAGIRKDVADILSASDLFVFPSLFEGLGLALVEAQATGLKSIANKQLPKEVFIADNVIGLDIDDVTCWIKAIKKLVADKYDRRKIALTIQESRFNISNEAKILMQKYEEWSSIIHQTQA